MDRRKCSKCGSTNLRLEVPPDFEAFEVCRECGKIQEGSVDEPSDGPELDLDLEEAIVLRAAANRQQRQRVRDEARANAHNRVQQREWHRAELRVLERLLARINHTINLRRSGR